MTKPFDLDDVLTLEEDETASELDEALALQRAINSGLWSLQGTDGRNMMDAIEDGRCMLGESRATDYWGNRIPARSDVKDGTKGSRSFVADAMGEDWAVAMEGA